MSIAEKLVTIAENEQKVYEAGQKSEYDRFWDIFQDNGNRKDYPYAFGYTWNDYIYNPKYPIITTNSAYMFRYTKITDTKVDISANIYNYVFEYAQQLKTIHKLIVSENATFISTFRNCIELENIIFEGVIGTDISFKDSKLLSHDSLMSIINALKDFSATETFANVDYYWDGNYPYEHTPKNDFVYNVKSATVSGSDIYFKLDVNDDSLTLILWANNVTVSGDISKIKTAMISSDGTLTLTFEPTTTKTLTLHADAKARLTAAEIQSAEDKGWNVE